MRGKDNMRSGGEVLVDQLIANGVQHVFCVPGESYLAALDAFHDRNVAVTVCRQEGGAVMMAEAAGKLTGRPGIAFVTRGPGATNGSPGIHIAKQDSTPLIMFVGQVGRDMREREAFQELDYRAVFGTMAKWATEIDDPERIPEIVSHAFHVAMNGRPGPVVIALPEDMLMERVSVADALAAEPIETWPGLNRHVAAAEDALVGREAARDSRRQPLVGSCVRRGGPLRGALRSSGRHVVSPHAAVSSDASVLRGRSRHRRQSEAGRARESRGPPAAGRRAARRNAEPGLHAARYPQSEDQARPRLPGPGRTRSCLPAASRHQRNTDRIRGVARRRAAAERDPLARLDQGGACRLRRLDRAADEAAGRRQFRRDHGVAARATVRRQHHHQRRGQFLDVDAPLLSLHQIRDAARSDLRLDGLRRCRPRSAQNGSIRSARWCASRATGTS